MSGILQEEYAGRVLKLQRHLRDRGIDLAILNYNGRKHLEHLLPTASVAAAEFPGICSIVAIENRQK